MRQVEKGIFCSLLTLFATILISSCSLLGFVPLPYQFVRLDRAFFAAFSPDGQWIVTTMGGVAGRVFPAATIWDAEQGARITDLDSTYVTLDAAFIPSSNILVTDPSDTKLEVWSTIDWSKITDVQFQNLVCDLDPHPSGVMLLVATCGPGDNLALLLDTTTWETTSQIAAFSEDGIPHVAFSPSGSMIAYTRNSLDEKTELYIWDAVSGDQLHFHEQPSQINSLIWSLDENYVISGSSDGTIRVWDLETDQQVIAVTQRGSVDSMDVSPDGQFIVAGGEQSATIYRLENWTEITVLGQQLLKSVQFSPDGLRILTVTFDPTDAANQFARVFDVSSFVNENTASSIIQP